MKPKGKILKSKLLSMPDFKMALYLRLKIPFAAVP